MKLKTILIPDEKYGFVVDVNGNVNLFGKYLTTIPVKFNKVSGNFYCYYNQLTSLEFSPRIVRGNFECSGNQLTSLEFCPQRVGGGFYCADNQELKEIQKIINFKEILLEHKKALITKFSDKLENKLQNDKNKKTTKVKI